jgi:hypothetical protein
VSGRLFNAAQTVFHTFGVVLSENTLRNTAFDIVASHCLSSVADLFVGSAPTPLVFAELLLCDQLRADSTKRPSLGRDFFACEPVISSLIAASLGLQQAPHNPDVPGVGYAKSIIFKTLFGLLDDRATAQSCLDSAVFATGFLSLMFEADFAGIVVESLSNCLTQLQTLPEQVPLFLVSVFEACSRHHSDAHLSRVARGLSHAIVRSLSYNARLSPQFDQVLDPALTMWLERWLSMAVIVQVFHHLFWR